jgi:hypothetical protein
MRTQVDIKGSQVTNSSLFLLGLGMEVIWRLMMQRTAIGIVHI